MVFIFCLATLGSQCLRGVAILQPGKDTHMRTRLLLLPLLAFVLSPRR